MGGRRVLIAGASVAGPFLALWLARYGFEPVLVERAPRFRDGGQNVDVRGAAHEVVERMGLTEQVRARSTTEEGTAWIGGRGQVLGGIPADREQDGPTAELEILRGDLARLILETLPSGTSVRYGDRVDDARTVDDGVQVRFGSGAEARYDLLVVAEGVRSTTRDAVFGDAVDRRELGLNMAYGTIPRAPGDDRWWRWYTAEGRRGVTLRPDDVGSIRATLAYVDRAERISDLTVPEAKQRLAQVFAGAGWEADRVVRGFQQSADVYVDALTQVRMRTWSAGRVAVTGDAAWCVTPLGGGGTSIALVGAFVLAAFLSQEAGDPGPALQRYERWMRPYIDDAQRLPPGTPDLFYPEGRVGVGVLRTVQRALSSPPLRSLGARFAHVARSDRPLPEPRLVDA